MMKNVLAIALLLLAMGSATAKADIIYSISDSDPLAGSDLTLGLGQTGSMFVWVSTNPGQTYTGIGLDLLSGNPAIVQATNYEIFNPSTRWADVDTGELGDLVTDANAVALPGFVGDGLSTSGLDDFALFSEVQFTATEIGSTGLSFEVNSNGIGDLEGLVDPSGINFGTGTLTAVPEPSGLAVLGLASAAYGFRRYRKKQTVSVA
jgi:hypothetical protein